MQSNCVYSYTVYYNILCSDCCCGAQHDRLVGHQSDAAGRDLIAQLPDGLVGDQSVLELGRQTAEHIIQVDILDGIENVEQRNVHVISTQVTIEKGFQIII